MTPHSPPKRAAEGSGTEAVSATSPEANRLPVRAARLPATSKNLWVKEFIRGGGRRFTGLPHKNQEKVTVTFQKITSATPYYQSVIKSS